jgi:glycosyltransferase involved in cell wall biosynthesis
LTTPTVSVGLPVFNGAEYLRDSIEALLSQTYTDFELLISDNASTDRTAEICEEYARRDPRIRFMRQKANRGAATNFKLLLDEAVGTYFMWAAADDLVSANWIEHLLGNMRGTDFGVFGGYQYINQSGKAEGPPVTPRSLRRHSQMMAFLLPDTCGKCFYMYALFRRKQLASLPLFEVTPFLGNDQIFIIRFLEQGDLRSIPGAVLSYRIHDANTSAAESRDLGLYRRQLLSVFPAVYYRNAIAALPPIKRLLVLPLVPLKYLFEQGRSYRNFGREVIRKLERLGRAGVPAA